MPVLALATGDDELKKLDAGVALPSGDGETSPSHPGWVGSSSQVNS